MRRRRPLTKREREEAKRWYERGDGSAGDNTIIAIVAPKGGGKSTLTWEIVQEHPRVTIFDAMGEHGNKPTQKCEVAWEEDCLPLMHEKAKLPLDERFRISLRMAEDEEALQLFEMAWEMPNTLLVVEEGSRFCSPSKLPREVAKVIRFGRHRNISQLWITRRPAELHRDITANADLIVAFRCHEGRDIEYMTKILGDKAEQLRHLPKFKVMVHGDLKRAPLAVVARLHEPAQRSLDLKAEGA